MRALLLKAGVTALTFAAAIAAAAHVSGDVKDASAPLHPPVAGAAASVPTTADGQLRLAPSVRSANVQAVTSTYES